MRKRAMNEDNTTSVPPLLYNQPGASDYPQHSTSSSWRDALSNILSFIETTSSSEINPPFVLFKNEKYVCLYDKYPKAKHHCLLLPRRGILLSVSSINELTPHHLASIREFHTVAKNIVHQLQKTILPYNNDRAITFKLGYHAIPSLTPLHLHIISTDFDSICIKTKRHVNSFTSAFFVSAETLEEHLESAFVSLSNNKSLFVDVRRNRAENLLNGRMKCVKCHRAAANVPDWKRHNQACTAVANDTPKLFNVLLGWIGREYYVTESMPNPNLIREAVPDV